MLQFVIHRWVIGGGGFIGEVSLALEEPLVRDWVLLTNLHVHPLRRGLGWSHTLLTAALRYADKRNYTLYLRPQPYNNCPLTQAQLVKLYRKYGFKKRGEIMVRSSNNHLQNQQVVI